MGEAALELKKVSAEQYLTEEQGRTHKCEYVDGRLHAFAGATDRHNRVAGNVFFRIRQAVGAGPCRVYVSDTKLRIRTDLTERFYYPDVMVTCGEDDTNDLYKVAPSLLTEVMSPSTVNTDRREKLPAYQGIRELQDYLIVSPDERLVERYRRDAKSWWVHEYRDDGVIKLPYLKLELTLNDIYEGL